MAPRTKIDKRNDRESEINSFSGTYRGDDREKCKAEDGDDCDGSGWVLPKPLLYNSPNGWHSFSIRTKVFTESHLSRISKRKYLFRMSPRLQECSESYLVVGAQFDRNHLHNKWTVAIKKALAHSSLTIVAIEHRRVLFVRNKPTQHIKYTTRETHELRVYTMNAKELLVIIEDAPKWTPFSLRFIFDTLMVWSVMIDELALMEDSISVIFFSRWLLSSNEWTNRSEYKNQFKF